MFGYDVGGLDSAELDGSLLIGETDSDSQVEPGDYTLTETIPGGAPWSHVSTVCTVAGGEPITITDPEDTFPVETGKTTSCVITNATSFVEVEKQTLPDGSPELFDFTIDGADLRPVRRRDADLPVRAGDRRRHHRDRARGLDADGCRLRHH